MTLRAAEGSGLQAARLWARSVLGGEIRLDPLAGDGGGRRYFRIETTEAVKPLSRPPQCDHDQASAARSPSGAGRDRLLLLGPDPAENLAWLRIGRHLWFQGLALPRLYDHDLERGFFLLEDLGDRRLADSPTDTAFFAQAVELAARLHQRGLCGFNAAWCFQTRAYDAAMIADQEIGYFLNWLYGRYLQRPAPPRGVAGEVRTLARLAAPRPEARVLMHRDYQSRNLMIRNGRVYALDWQGARPGAAAYDLVSLLEETPGGPLTGPQKENLLDLYLRLRGRGAWRRTFRGELILVGAARLMQALGAYGKLTLAGKPVYAGYMLPVARRLRELFADPLLARFPILRAVAEETAERLTEKNEIG